MPIDVSGHDRIDVVGESFRRDALRRVTGADRGQEPARGHVATLTPEPANAYDRNAVKVLIAGEHVGYVPRWLAALVAAPISELTAKHGEVTAIAEIGGSDSELGFGVALYLKLQMLNVVIVQEEEDLDDKLLISDDEPVASSTGTLTTPAPRTASEAAQTLGVSEETIAARRKTVERAVERWKTDLIDLTARNRLLYLRDLQTGTLSFEDASRDALMELVAGKRIALSKLVPRSLPPKNPAAQFTPFQDAVRRARAITRTARTYEEERGIRTLYLACGLATWKSDRATRPPAAPVLLVPIEIRARGASQQDFELATLGELEINPTLLHLLRVEFRREINEQELLGHDEMDGAIDTPEELRLAFDWLSEKCASVPGWAIADRFVLGNFWYAKLPMVRDLESALDTIASHDLAAALAGHAEAREAVLTRRAATARELLPVDAIDPREEFNVLDSDSSQSVAIGRALAGEDLVLKGPPGTGKSQTIANLICGAVGAGKRVLFVAEKRAAIEAVTKRLRATGLEHLVLDLHAGAESRKWLAGQLGASLEAIRTVGESDAQGDHAQLVRLRDTLKAHAQELHRTHAPWDVSIYRAQMEVLDRSRPEVTARLRGADLQAVTAPRLEELLDHLRDLISLDGLSLRHRDSPWAEADVQTTETVAQVKDAVEAVSGPLLHDDGARPARRGNRDGAPSPFEGLGARCGGVPKLDQALGVRKRRRRDLRHRPPADDRDAAAARRRRAAATRRLGRVVAIPCRSPPGGRAPRRPR
jgi:chaperonin cofactor prefoldin